jgi:hypothetical protein
MRVVPRVSLAIGIRSFFDELPSIAVRRNAQDHIQSDAPIFERLSILVVEAFGNFCDPECESL